MILFGEQACSVAIRKGYTPPVEDTPDADQPDDNPEESLGVLSAEGDNAN